MKAADLRGKDYAAAFDDATARLRESFLAGRFRIPPTMARQIADLALGEARQ